MSRLRVGLIGFGSMGKNHARVLNSSENCDFIAIVDPNKNLGRYPINGIPRLNNLAELLKLGVDACIVAVPTSLHGEIGFQLAKNKIHTLMEKPLAHSFSIAQELAKEFSNANLIGAVGHIERFNPAIQQLSKRLSAKQLGEVFQITTSRHGPFPGRINDVGVINDLASHDIDLTRFVTNSEYASIFALTNHRSGSQHEDSVLATGQLQNGTIVNHSVNWLTPFKERQILVVGEKGAFIGSTLTGDLTFFENGNFENDWDNLSSFRGVSEGNVIRYSYHKNEPLKNEIESFLLAVRTLDTSPIVTMESASKTVEVCSALIESAKSESKQVLRDYFT